MFSRASLLIQGQYKVGGSIYHVLNALVSTVELISLMSYYLCVCRKWVRLVRNDLFCVGDEMLAYYIKHTF